MPAEVTTYSVLHVRLLLQGARACGLDDAALLRWAGVNPALIDDPDARLPREVVYALWDEVARRSGDASFGLHMAEHSPRGAFGVVEYVSRNAATLGEALRYIARYGRLIHDGASIELISRADGAHLVMRSVAGASPRPLMEWTLGYVLISCRDVTGVDLAPARAAFRHAAPPDVAEYARLFRCPITFSAPHNELVVEAAHLELPIRRGDPELVKILARFAEERLARLPVAEDFLDRLRWAVLELLPAGAPRLPDVAHLMATSVRSLQRRLQEEGTSFQEMVNEIRHETAARHLAGRDLGIGEIAFLLGFSEPSAFHRSFKRWSGMTPSEYRQRGVSAASR